MSAFSRSINFIKASQKVLAINPKLLWMPLIFLIVFMITNATSFAVAGLLAKGSLVNFDLDFATTSQTVIFYGAMLIDYILMFYIYSRYSAIVYLMSEAALAGQIMTIGQAYSESAKVNGPIWKWAVFSGSIYLILRYIEDKLEIVGRWISGIIGTVFSVAATFAVPVLLKKKAGPVDTLKESGQLFIRTWGENMIINISFGGISILATIAVVLATGGLAAYAYTSASFAWLTIPIGVIGAMVLVGLITYFQTLSMIVYAALFRFADTGDYVGPFSEEMLKEAVIEMPRFARKKSATV